MTATARARVDECVARRRRVSPPPRKSARARACTRARASSHAASPRRCDALIALARAGAATIGGGAHAGVARLRGELDDARLRRQRGATRHRDWQLATLRELYEHEAQKARASCVAELGRHKENVEHTLQEQIKTLENMRDNTPEEIRVSARSLRSKDGGHDDDALDALDELAGAAAGSKGGGGGGRAAARRSPRGGATRGAARRAPRRRSSRRCSASTTSRATSRRSRAT